MAVRAGTDDEKGASKVINRFGRRMGVLVVSGGLGLGISACNTGNSTSNPAPSRGSSATTATVRGVTLAEFNQVTNGMTYQQVSTIFRSPGTVQADTNIAGQHTQVYTWNGTTVRANAIVTFNNGMVIVKVQYGLE